MLYQSVDYDIAVKLYKIAKIYKRKLFILLKSESKNLHM